MKHIGHKIQIKFHLETFKAQIQKPVLSFQLQQPKGIF
jgi:hypothetical protein